jgi:hypothetical protein
MQLIKTKGNWTKSPVYCGLFCGLVQSSCQSIEPDFQAPFQKYITDINEPFSCKLEGILASFGCQKWLEDVYMMETTHITDYSTHK